MAHLWQLIESNGGKPVAKAQTADYAILPMNTIPEEKLQAKQMVSAYLFKLNTVKTSIHTDIKGTEKSAHIMKVSILQRKVPAEM